MSVRFTDAFSKSDWIKIAVLLVIAVGLWVWVYQEMQKPIIPPEWEKEYGIHVQSEQ